MTQPLKSWWRQFLQSALKCCNMRNTMLFPKTLTASLMMTEMRSRLSVSPCSPCSPQRTSGEVKFQFLLKIKNPPMCLSRQCPWNNHALLFLLGLSSQVRRKGCRGDQWPLLTPLRLTQVLGPLSSQVMVEWESEVVQPSTKCQLTGVINLQRQRLLKVVSIALVGSLLFTIKAPMFCILPLRYVIRFLMLSTPYKPPN